MPTFIFSIIYIIFLMYFYIMYFSITHDISGDKVFNRN